MELHSLQKAQTLNGQRGEIVGFDDKQLRYRVRLHSDNTVTWRISTDLESGGDGESCFAFIY